jgi:phosphoenolpyruvate---glycerone phosphotransferase subunit DhaL
MSGLDGRFWTRAIDALAAAFARAEAVLCGYDGAIGDGDHGSSMLRGFQEAQAGLRGVPAAAPGTVCARTGDAFVENVGGVTGMVFGSLFAAAGLQAASLQETDSRALHEMFRAGLASVKKVGKAVEGDKCMVDALAPAVAALAKAAETGRSAAAAFLEAARAAEAGRDATIPMEARVGRARYQAAKGRGHVDAGAASVCLIFQTLARAAGEESPGT